MTTSAWLDRAASPAKLEERRLRYLKQLQHATDVGIARYAYGRLVDVEQELARREHRKYLILARYTRKCHGSRADVAHYLTLACTARGRFRVAGEGRQAVHM